MTVEVWAPNANQVECETEDGRLELKPDARGWWRGDVELPPGTDYAFRLDGGAPLPDPRSPYQPHGVHGRSRAVDHNRFAWDDAHWQAPPLSSALIYEVHVGTFTPQGTFDAVIDKLDHLIELGVTHLELMPVAEFPGSRGWGYDGVDLFAPHHAYGGPDGLKRLINACHQRGLAVLIDVVYNHLGPSGNYLAQFGPYFTDRHHTPWGSAVNFDSAHADEVRRFFCDNALMWLRDYHADGLRLDAIHAIVDTSAFPFLEQLALEVNELAAHLGRHLVLIAESDLNDPRVIRPRELGGFGIDAQWSDDFHHALHAVLTGERDGYYADFGRLADLAAAFEQSYVYAGRFSSFRGRSHGRPVRGLSGHHFLSYLQNHDQLGNRAKGDRSRHLMNERRLKIGAALVLTSPFVPMLFQGEDWAASAPFQYFVGFDDEPELARRVSEGRRREFAAFGWSAEEIPDPQDIATFQRSKVNWDELKQSPHKEMYDWHRQLIRLRREHSSLTDGRLDRVDASFDEERQWLVVERGPIAIVCNFAGSAQRIASNGERPPQLLLTSDPGAEVGPEGIMLPPETVAIVHCEAPQR